MLEINAKLTNDLEVVNDWLIDNKLSLHLGKTESILFGSRPKLKSDSCLHIICNSTNIKSTDSVKYLGATIDQHMSCESIATNIIQKANATLKFLYRKRFFKYAYKETFSYVPYTMPL